VISEWQLQLPADPSNEDPAQFDYETISDVILHMRYTAREGGGPLRNGAIAHVKKLITEAKAAGSVRLFSVRHEFPTEWARFQSQAPIPDQRFELALNLREEHYPLWSQGHLNRVQQVDLLARSSKPTDQIPASLDIYDQVNDQPQAAKKDTLANGALGNLLVGRFAGGATGIALPPSPVSEFRIFVDDNRAIKDLWIAVTWGSV
jgi:hypothetical protein